MKYIFYGLALVCVFNANASMDLSDLPNQESLQAMLSDFEQQPTNYLPHYTANPPELNVENIENHPLAATVAQSYQNNQAQIAELKADKIANTDNQLSQSLSQALAAKYKDYSHCAKADIFQENDFKQAVTNMAVLSDAAQQTPQIVNEKAYSLFQGQALQCRKYGFGYLNCCSDSGWGQFVSECNSQEIALRQAREKGTVIFLGTKKSGSKLKKKKFEVYCVFESKLARMLQEQGRWSQLFVNFGDPQAPNCRGISAEELSRIDLDLMNLYEIYPAMVNHFKPFDQQALVNQVKSKLDD